MNLRIIVAAGVLVVGVGAVVVWSKSTCNAGDSCASSNTDQKSRAALISEEVKSGNARLIDVREPDEYAVEHAEGATLLPLADVQSGKLNEPDKAKKIYLYCRSGQRAKQALEALKNQGYTNAESLGGLSDWQNLGGKLVK